MVWWCCSFAECRWHIHSAVVAGTGVLDSSYQLELEVSRLHFFSGGGQAFGMSSDTLDTAAQALIPPWALRAFW